MQALFVVHSAGVVHCDVTLSSLFMLREGDLNSLMLGRFRNAMALGPQGSVKSSAQRGDLSYAAPELVSNVCAVYMLWILCTLC